ncbi:unnamed protein product, partial [marine sediment metagenome]
MRFRSKRYKKELEQLTPVSTGAISLAEAVEKVKLFKSVKFDQTI